MSFEWSAAAAFDLGGSIIDVQPYGRGLINDTYLVRVDADPPRRAILQRINRRVFPEPELITQNLRTLVEHARRRRADAVPGARDLRLPDVYTTREGQDFVSDPQGGFWRAQSFIEHTRTVGTLTDPGQAEEVGHALGRFHALIHDLDPNRLHETLPGFHNTPRYLARYTEVAARPRRAPDGADLRQCLAFVEARRPLAEVLETAKRADRLALRPIHGDPKLDNFLFDVRSGRAASLIDLDTVQPGLIHYDIGDCLRSCCNPAGESPADLAAVHFDLDLCRAILKGYLSEARGFLTAQDYGHLYHAIRLIPFELGVRFLTDHLEGDRYFKTDAPGRNLHRARVQFRLTESIEQHAREIEGLIAGLGGI
ncbi:MAG: aminoglycoside phosphotransferase family protein [Gammaproteobacteria bacterium]|nr:aminoglycoside phosphotransferase family protein [Gammaproteobacteria bacterium]